MKVLILAPHTDDGEIGAGGSIAKFIEEGNEVFYVAFSVAEESVPEGFSKDILFKEVKEATKTLGIMNEKLIIFRYPVRKFEFYRQQILEDLVVLNKDLQPDLVIMPSLNDIHQDHYTISIEGLRAFKKTSILGYEMPWNNIEFKSTSFIKLNKKHIERKVEALSKYKSQKNIRKYMDEEYIFSLARTRGIQINTEYAETFEVIRWIIN